MNKNFDNIRPLIKEIIEWRKNPSYINEDEYISPSASSCDRTKQFVWDNSTIINESYRMLQNGDGGIVISKSVDNLAWDYEFDEYGELEICCFRSSKLIGRRVIDV